MNRLIFFKHEVQVQLNRKLFSIIMMKIFDDYNSQHSTFNTIIKIHLDSLCLTCDLRRLFDERYEGK